VEWNIKLSTAINRRKRQRWSPKHSTFTQNHVTDYTAGVLNLPANKNFELTTSCIISKKPVINYYSDLDLVISIHVK